MPQYINLFPVINLYLYIQQQIYRSCIQYSIVKRNATRICSTYTTALNPVSCIPFFSCLFSLLTGEKSCSLLDKVPSFNELIY